MIRRLPPEILACCRAAGKSFTHVDDGAAPRPITGRWLGEHLWLCAACGTRNPADDPVCTNCSRGARP